MTFVGYLMQLPNIGVKAINHEGNQRNRIGMELWDSRTYLQSTISPGDGG